MNIKNSLKVFALLIVLFMFTSLCYSARDNTLYKSTLEEPVAGIGVLLDQLSTNKIMTALNGGVN